MTVDPQFATIAGLEDCVGRCMERFQVTEWQPTSQQSRVMSVAETVLSEYLTEDGDIAEGFELEHNLLRKLRILWFSDDFYLALRGRSRADLVVAFARGTVQNEAFEAFLVLVDSIRPYWAELNDEDITGFPTLCTLEGNRMAVPRFGSCNFFGNTYVDFFGGRQVFRKAGFQYLHECDNGLFVGIPDARNNAEYLEVRHAIEQSFPDPTLFDRRVRGRRLPYLGDGIPPEDRITEIEITIRDKNQ